MRDTKQIDAKIAILKARIKLLEAEKEEIQEIENLNKEGYYIASELARVLGFSRAYIGNNKFKYQMKIYKGREYFKVI